MLRVAVIEDDPAMRARLAEAIGETSDLTFAGSASNMAEAEILIDSGGYDVLLCDLGLPDGSGIDLIKRETLTERDTDIRAHRGLPCCDPRDQARRIADQSDHCAAVVGADQDGFAGSSKVSGLAVV
jgi:CheY-like chemotaxis protein